MYTPKNFEEEMNLADFFVNFKVKNIKPTQKEENAIIGFFDEDLLIPNGALIKITEQTFWIVGDAENPEWLTKKFAENDRILEQIETNDTVLFLGIIVCGIKRNVRERTPMYQHSKRKKSDDKKLDWAYFIKIITKQGRMGYYLLPFYELNDRLKTILKLMFVPVISKT